MIERAKQILPIYLAEFRDCALKSLELDHRKRANFQTFLMVSGPAIRLLCVSNASFLALVELLSAARHPGAALLGRGAVQRCGAQEQLLHQIQRGASRGTQGESIFLFLLWSFEERFDRLAPLNNPKTHFDIHNAVDSLLPTFEHQRLIVGLSKFCFRV